eukprot:scaffold117879_cov18-Tisochrysis_lutea.AAC.1
MAEMKISVRSDARETREAISDVLNNEDVLQSVCLSQRVHGCNVDECALVYTLCRALVTSPIKNTHCIGNGILTC